MPRFPIAVTYLDGSDETIEAGRPAVLIAFADEFRKPFPDTDGPDLMRELSWLAWRAKRPEQPFDEWIETVADIEGEGDEEEVEPAESPPPEQPVEPSPTPEPEPEPEPEPTEQAPTLMLATPGGA